MSHVQNKKYKLKYFTLFYNYKEKMNLFRALVYTIYLQLFDLKI